jgi:hypothetical protein
MSQCLQCKSSSLYECSDGIIKKRFDWKLMTILGISLGAFFLLLLGIGWFR